MGRSLRRLPPPPELRRPAARLDVPPALLIVCEGATEEQILRDLCSRWGICQASVLVLGQKGEPQNLVKAARAERLKHRPHPETWVVFDRDAHDHWADAIDRAHALGFHVAHSNPCFELWALLLHQDQFAALERGRAQSLLSQVHPGYHHKKHPYLDVETVIEQVGARTRLDEAARRSEALDRRALEADAARGNPTTSFSALIARLRREAR